MAEQVAGNTIPDVLTLQGEFESDDANGLETTDGGLAVAVAPPRMAVRAHLGEDRVLAARSRRIVIRHSTGDRIVALLEIVSPGNKSSRDAVDQFVDKASAALNGGFHRQMIDLFPPGTADPQGMHGSLWSSMGGQYQQPIDKPLTLAAYAAGGGGLLDCYVEPTTTGSPLLEMPLFLSRERYVNVPLEQTYQDAYHGMPERWKRVIEMTSD